MSPEQAGGSRELDGRSDLYSLGCVLYEMLAGHPPFTGMSAQEVLLRHSMDAVPLLTAARPAVPPHVERAINTALAKVPADRYRTASQFAEALGPRTPSAVAASPPVPAVRVRARRPWKRLAPLGVAAVVVLAAAAVVGRWLRPGSTVLRHPRTAIAVLPFENLSAEGPNAYFAGGLQDELITQLAKVAALKPISRTSVMEYATRTKPLRQIADELSVGTIIEASVQAVGERLLVNVRLIDAATDRHLWAEGRSGGAVRAAGLSA